ncbi:outer membrane homotrimeric porin [Oleidesulfovibrio sp.]|uniref:outer membrane homotrimeric porin n=1 Tax=Oleidesulfovibrio sp. TaxID=2909707 RepID=UPI003A8422DC
MMRRGGALGTDGVNIETRRAYIDFFVPGTDLQFRMGLQGLALPAAVAGSPVMDDDVAAIVGSYSFNDMFSLSAFWARPYNINNGDTTNQNLKDEFDFTGLVLDINGDGFSISPYGVYGLIGKDAGVSFNNVAVTGDDASAWWAGTAFELNMFDPIVFYADAIYGAVGTDNDAAEASGWFLTGKLAYKLDMFTPTLTAWYGSGDDDDSTDGTERLPVISPAGFSPTSFGFDGGAGILRDRILSRSGAGTWGVVLAAEDIKFFEDISHAVRVGYYEGTNDKDADIYNTTNLNLSEKDSAWEINVDTNYQIYENLTAALQLGWIKLDLDDEVWGADDDTEDAWRCGVNLTYRF